jgi:protein-L-isoaspartate(D-aspartate) O-methyltransferase
VSDSYGGYRARLVEQLRRSGVRDLAVLRAFGETPRHLFVPEALRNRAYDDTSLPIGFGQTISQPRTQAAFLETLELRGDERVLEVGTGSGFQAALLSMLVSHVVTVERVPELAETARRALATVGAANVMVVVGDGSLGWKPTAPYDAILVAAAGPRIPECLLTQLVEGGRVVMPVQGADGRQHLVRAERTGDRSTQQTLADASFVPLLGRHGFEPDSNSERPR